MITDDYNLIQAESLAGTGYTFSEKVAILKEKIDARAGVDVYDSEPIQNDCPLVGLRNVLLTPHIAGATHETKGRGRAITNVNIKRVLQGETPINIVNQ
jgi:lactate dehydrogenase-like 2-hydroxyacid dehydrogenase